MTTSLIPAGPDAWHMIDPCSVSVVIFNVSVFVIVIVTVNREQTARDSLTRLYAMSIMENSLLSGPQHEPLRFDN